MRSWTALLGVVVMSWGARASAQHVTLDQYAAPMTADDGLALPRAASLARKELSALATLDYARDPLVVEAQSGGSTALVQHQAVMQTQFAYGLADRLTLVAGLDVVLAMEGKRFAEPVSQTSTAPADGGGLGDARLGARYQALGDAHSLFALAVQGQLSLPLARAAQASQHLRGEHNVAFRPDVIAELRPGRFRFDAVLGALVREDGRLLGTRLGDAFRYGLGAAVRLPGKLEPVQVMAELYGSTAFRDAFARAVSPLELLLGARALLREHWQVGLGAGPGLSHGFGAPSLRVLGTLSFKLSPKP